jgi:foldase protein PrsA
MEEEKLKNIKRIVAVSLFSILLFSATGCNKIEKTQAAIDKTIVAEVDGESITRKELDSDEETVYVIESIKAQYGEDYGDNEEAMEALKTEKSRILDNMVLDKLLMAEVDRRGIMPTDEELTAGINEQYDSIKSQFESEEAFTEALEAQGATEESLKEYIKKSVIYQKLQEDMLKDVAVSEEEVQKYYDEYSAKYPVNSEDPTIFTLSHILVATEEEANEVKKKIDDGADFAEMAAEYGTDGTKDNGGDLGEIPANTEDYDADFMKGAMVLKVGEVSEPVETQFGFHIIKCTARNDKESMPFEDVKASIEAELTYYKENDTITAVVDQLKESAKIKKYEDRLI